MKIFNWNELNKDEQLQVLSRPSVSIDGDVIDTVTSIIEDVRKQGDDALLKYTKKFDGVDLDELRVPLSKIENAHADISATAKMAIDKAYTNIKAFHAYQGYQPYQTEIDNGVLCSRRVVPVQAVGLYIPGGTAPLVSTTLMCGVPAQIAACPKIVMSTPADKDGNVDPNVLYAANLCGIDTVFKVGGAQAIAAMAYGTNSVDKVDKIFGPGNAYVTMAKTLVSKDPMGAALDMPAGPSEVLVIADDTSDVRYVAADLLSQAEHDTMSQVILIATSNDVAKGVMQEVWDQMKSLSRKDIAESAIENSRAIVVADLDQAMDVSNRYAPEHLILSFTSALRYTDKVSAAGSIFVGKYACESAGDYCSGTNHVLPTFGYATQYSGLSVEAFQKTMTMQSISREGLERIADTIETLAELEGLDAHARAVSIRRRA